MQQRDLPFLTVAELSRLLESRAEQAIARGGCRGPMRGIPMAAKDRSWRGQQQPPHP